MFSLVTVPSQDLILLYPSPFDYYPTDHYQDSTGFQITIKMKAFTTIFAIGAILGTTLASPIAVGDVALERLDVEQRDVEVDIANRQLPVPGLPTLPPITLPANPGDLGPALSSALSQVVTILGGISK